MRLYLDEKEGLQSEKKELEALRITIQTAEKELDKFKRLEKDKRFKMEERIRKRYEKEGAVVLESGAVIATRHPVQIDMEVRSQQLLCTIETVKEKEEELDSVKKEFKVAMSSVEKKLEKKNSQLLAFRRKQKTRKQREARELAAHLKRQTSRYHSLD